MASRHRLINTNNSNNTRIRSQVVNPLPSKLSLPNKGTTPSFYNGYTKPPPSYGTGISPSHTGTPRSRRNEAKAGQRLNQSSISRSQLTDITPERLQQRGTTLTGQPSPTGSTATYSDARRSRSKGGSSGSGKHSRSHSTERTSVGRVSRYEEPHPKVDNRLREHSGGSARRRSSSVDRMSISPRYDSVFETKADSRYREHSDGSTRHSQPHSMDLTNAVITSPRHSRHDDLHTTGLLMENKHSERCQLKRSESLHSHIGPKVFPEQSTPQTIPNSPCLSKKSQLQASYEYSGKSDATKTTGSQSNETSPQSGPRADRNIQDSSTFHHAVNSSIHTRPYKGPVSTVTDSVASLRMTDRSLPQSHHTSVQNATSFCRTSSPVSDNSTPTNSRPDKSPVSTLTATHRLSAQSYHTSLHEDNNSKQKAANTRKDGVSRTGNVCVYGPNIHCISPADFPESGGRVGMSNLGNTCFMNSMLQCLGQTGEMASIFLDMKNSSSSQELVKGI